MFRRLRNYFFTGLFVIVPIGVTIWIVFGVFQFMDNWFRDLVMSQDWWEEYVGAAFPYEHGVGFVLTITIICMVGFFASLYIGRKVLDLVDYIFSQIPGVSTIYNGLKQISVSISGRRSKIFEKVVLIEYPRRGIYSLAFITAEDEGVFSELLNEELVYVFMPTTPNPTSGFFLLIPKCDAVELKLTVEEAMKMIISSGMVAPKRVKPVSQEALEQSHIMQPGAPTQ
ncbi:DUF502 domain-containing protein [bacterium]|nr:DUF502 domain-containing protein [bacterium]